MTDEVVLGTETLPLKLTSHGGSEHSKSILINSGDFSTHRKSLNSKYMDLPHEKGTFLNFYKVKQELPGAFIKNLITNPNLSALEIKLALYLYECFQAKFPEGGVFILDRGLTVDNIGKFIGKDNFLYYSFPSEAQPFFDLDFAMHFQSIMKDMHIEYCESDVRQAILNLHNFSYITVTEVRWPNVQARGARNIKNSPKNTRVFALVIQLFPMMDEKDISKYWKVKNQN